MIIPGGLDRSSGVPLHAQLAQGLRAAIVAGRAVAGDAVPSTRALAADLGLSRGTVVAAYDTLAGEGYLVMRPGGGTVVADLPRHPVAGTAEIAVSAPRLDPGRIDLRPGRPGTRGLADAAWRAAWRRACAADPEPDVDDEAGDAALRAEIARHVARTRGLDVDPSEVIVTAGTSDALLLSVLAVSVAPPSRGAARVGIENPGYPRVRWILARLGVEAVPIPVSPHAGLDLDAIEERSDLDAVIVTPQHHYPLGSRMDAAARARLLSWADRTGAVVIEDDYDSEFPHGRAPLPPLRLGDPDRVALIGTLSKVVSPALRCGWVIASGALRGRLLDVRSDLDLPVSVVQQRALAEYLAAGALSRHAARRRRDYRHRRTLVVNAFAGLEGVELVATDGGLHAVLLVSGAGSADGVATEGPAWVGPVPEEATLVQAIAARGVVVSGLSEYAVPGEPSRLPPGLVFGYAAPTTMEMTDALAVIRDVLRDRPRP